MVIVLKYQFVVNAHWKGKYLVICSFRNQVTLPGLAGGHSQKQSQGDSCDRYKKHTHYTECSLYLLMLRSKKVQTKLGKAMLKESRYTPFNHFLPLVYHVCPKIIWIVIPSPISWEGRGKGLDHSQQPHPPSDSVHDSWFSYSTSTSCNSNASFSSWLLEIFLTGDNTGENVQNCSTTISLISNAS